MVENVSGLNELSNTDWGRPNWRAVSRRPNRLMSCSALMKVGGIDSWLRMALTNSSTGSTRMACSCESSVP